MKFRVSAALLCGVALPALMMTGPALADSITVTSGETVTTPQVLNTRGDTGTVESGGTVAVSNAIGIQGTSKGVTVNNAGTVTSSRTSGSIDEDTDIAIFVRGDSTVVNSGTASADFVAIGASGNYNSVDNSGTATGGSFGIIAFGLGDTINNGGTAEGEVAGIATIGFGTTIINSGRVISTATDDGDFFATAGIVALGNVGILNSGDVSGLNGIFLFGINSTLSNSGVIEGDRDGIFTEGVNIQITNSGTIRGGENAVHLGSSNTTLTLLAGSNVQGMLSLGNASNRLVLGNGINTAFAYEGDASISSSGAPMIVSGGIAAAVDPTGFAAANEAVTDLTRMVGTAVDERLTGARHGGAGEAMAMNGMLIAPVADVPAARDGDLGHGPRRLSRSAGRGCAGGLHQPAWRRGAGRRPPRLRHHHGGRTHRRFEFHPRYGHRFAVDRLNRLLRGPLWRLPAAGLLPEPGARRWHHA
jgi:hypothetical protein